MSADFKPVRRAQLISPFGVGALVDFPRDESLMTAGLDAWPHALEMCPDEWKIIEERLQQRLGVSHFRLPPDFRKRDADAEYLRKEVPYVRFPLWHFCPALGCGLMTKRSLLGAGTARCRSDRHSDVPEHRRPRVVPVRFIAVCPRGHIEDFPFSEWVHAGRTVDQGSSHELRFSAGRSAALAGITITCSCGARKNLGSAFQYDSERGGALHRIGYDCRGDQPWLGLANGEGQGCGQFLRVVQRGASNVYFPHTFSSIYLPLWGEHTDPRIVKALEEPRVWSILTDGLDEGQFISPERAEVVATMRGLDAEELKAAAQRKLDGDQSDQDATEEVYRLSEYEAFREERGGEGTDLLVEAVAADRYENSVGRFINRICLVRKLRETRALAGFSRLLPPGAEGHGGDIQQLARDPNVRWLPALIVRGEGLFIEFNEDMIGEWSRRPQVIERIARLSDSYNAARLQRGLPHTEVTPKFVLIHTFAHLLIRQLSFDCGYGSAALRERLYCNTESDAVPMQGVLIYTAAGDSEGTMGGLVRKGEPGNFESSFEEALRMSGWCSSDPVCIESAGQGSDNANLAACHACTLMPETSCEMGNRILDRALVSGMPENPDLGFFRQ